ncbi:Transposon Ty3-G Gag-Pol polyprotein [Sarcoptes scabiei]|uniref:RNA-directed DNA polymerase n=1 Tax=Sarcoptes scabiei TaxID=52283 RepID=A0A834R8W7_SARSC|nr:Transposon Ty3-G Gag-Pol polyprotein [Sarcoptes scabiei]
MERMDEKPERTGTLRKKTSQDQRPTELTYQSKVPLRCKRRNETVQEFLEIFESWMLINRWSDEEASLYLNCLIEERSLKQKLSQCERFNSYMAMKAALLSVDKAAKDRKIIQLRNVKFFIGGNVDAYFDKVSKLVDEIYAEEVSSMQIKRDMILSGLDPEMIAKLIVNQALPDDITNLKNLIFGLNLTMINKNRNKEWQKAKKNAKKFCQNCKTKTHNTEDCRSKKQNHPKCEKITNDISNPRYFVPMKFNGEEVLALFDSGSNRTIAPGNILKPETRFKKRCGTASKHAYLSVIGSTNVNLTLQDVEFKHNILIADDINHAIFGMDLINRLRLSWNEDRSINYWLNNQQYSLKLVKEDEYSILCMSIEEICNILPEDLSFDNEKERELQPIDPRVSAIIQKFPDIIKGTGKTNIIEHVIELKPGSRPIRLKPFRIHQALESKIEKQLAEMERTGIIGRSKSPWSSPLIAIEKKDHTLRLAVDYRKLNKMTIFDAQPAPRIDEILAGLRNACVFSKIDFRQGYYQVPLREEDKPKTAFQFKSKLYQFNVMPFGLSTACQTFIRMVEQLFGELEFVKTYIDDVLIFSKNEEEHLQHIEKVLSIVNNASLSINLEKSEFFKKEIEFLGLKIANNEIQMTTSKIKAIKAYPKPTNTKELKRFLGLASYYRKLIENFASIAQPLYRLMKKEVKFVWSKQEEEAFDLLKQKLSSKPILKMPDFNRTFWVRTDASDLAMAGVLSQRDENNNPYVIEYFSKTWTDCQKGIQ